tara:strand:- start:144 stop:587 length:444 start_codon:yes stop_codon:yes gene_type:complete
MASTVTASTMTVTISESITLNGKNQGGTNTLSIPSVAEVSKRIMTCLTSEVTLVSFAAAVAPGTFIDADVRYVRITNLDDTNFVTLNVEGEGSTDFSIRLDAGASYIMAGSFVDHIDISGATLENVSAIKGTANTAVCDLEVVVASA